MFSCDLIQKIKQQKPLVHNITNYVTVNDCANILLAAGGSPVMADDIAEVEDIVSISNALVINIGTLNERTIKSMLKAGIAANKYNKPVVLDPVGAGASKLRNDTVSKLLDTVHFSVIRGNLSEISWISGIHGVSKGVDVAESDKKKTIAERIEISASVSREYNTVVAVTGAVDVISNGTVCYSVENGVSLMGSITGTGCMCSALTGAFCAVTDRFIEAAASAILMMGAAGEIAYRKTQASGSFRSALIDSVNIMDADILKKVAKIYEK